MIHVIDLNSTENTHVIFNASIIKVLENAYPGVVTTFYSQKSHQSKVKDYFSDSDAAKIKFSELPRKGVGTNKILKISNGIRGMLFDLLFFVKILSLAKRSSDDDKIIVVKAHPASLLVLKNLKHLYPQVEVMVVMHGEIEYIYAAENDRQRQIASLYKRIVRSQIPKFRFIVLNKICMQSLISDGYLRNEDIIEIDHPYPYSETPLPVEKPVPPVTFGQVGSLGLRKNAHLTYKLSELQVDNIEGGLVRFVTIGPVEDDVLQYKNRFVKDFTQQDGKVYISRETFNKEIQGIDYSLFFFKPDQFIFRASGSVMDVVNFTKPIIAFKHPFFDYLIGKVGEIGFICDDLNEMSSLISRIAHQDAAILDRYRQQCLNLAKCKALLSIEQIARDFKEQAR